MSTESSQAPAQRPGGKDLNTGRVTPDPFVRGLGSTDGEPVTTDDAGGSGTEADGAAGTAE